MAIEFGSDNRPTSTVFGTGTGTNQESRKLHASMAMRLGVRAGRCRSCGVAYVSGASDALRLCAPCVAADASVKINGAPVSEINFSASDALNPTSSKLAFGSTSLPASERPLGADTLEDWT